MQDSEKSTRESIATPPSPLTPIAAAMKIMMAVMKTLSTIRGFTNIMSLAAAKRPMAKRPWPIAKRSEAAAADIWADSQA
jgi:hypothetical protein